MLHGKQYVIADQPFTSEGFSIIPLECGKTLSVHDGLRVQYDVGLGGGASCCLIGWAFQTCSVRAHPFEELKAVTSVEQLDSIVETWAGRWLVIWHDVLRMDACGLLGCFYSDDGIFSSSLALIETAKGRTPRATKLVHGFGLDYFPGANTMRRDIHRLLPSQSISVSSMVIEHHHLYVNDYSSKTDNDRIDMLIDSFDTMATSLRESYPGDMVLTLTGGYDSRTMMALLERTNVEYSTVTLEHGGMSEEDRVFPEGLARLRNVEWSFISREGKPNSQRYRIYDQHCGFMAVDEDRNFFAYDQYKTGNRPTALIRCGVAEVTVPDYIPYVSHCGLDIVKYQERLVNVRGRSDIARSLHSWLEDGWHDPRLDMSCDFYWNMRAGCWLSSVEQSLTVLDGIDSLQLFNCGRVLALLNGFDASLRATKQHEVMLIEAACPELLSIPFSLDERKEKTRRAKLSSATKYAKCVFTCLDAQSVPLEVWRSATGLLGRNRK